MNIISLGVGVQSTALYLMSSRGELPRCDYAIFSDLGFEKKATYQYLDWLLNWQKTNNGIEIIIDKSKNLFHDLLNQNNSKGKRFSSIPAFTKNEDGTIGMLRRQCTYEYKIEIVDKKIRQILGIKPRHKMPNVDVWSGITLDEMERMSNPQNAWKRNVYPFVKYAFTKKQNFKIDYLEERWHRAKVIQWYLDNNLPIPIKSGCGFCPYQSDANWFEMKKDKDQSDWEKVKLVDIAIRNSSKKGIQQPIYLHRSCNPIDQVQFDKNSELEWGICTGNCQL